LLKGDLSLREVARRLSVSLNTVQYNVSRMRRMGADVPGRANQSWKDDDEETRAEARARVARDLAAGARCPTCWLLLPCDDHG
jgi:transposase